MNEDERGSVFSCLDALGGKTEEGELLIAHRFEDDRRRRIAAQEGLQLGTLASTAYPHKQRRNQNRLKPSHRFPHVQDRQSRATGLNGPPPLFHHTPDAIVLRQNYGFLYELFQEAHIPEPSMRVEVAGELPHAFILQQKYRERGVFNG